MSKHSRLSSIYRTMKNRCYNPKSYNYQNYGGRGITICEEWLNNEFVKGEIGRKSKGFVAFREWATDNGYTDNLTLDRIDVNKGYSPENCRWVTMKVQSNNTRRNRIITYKGKSQTLAQWCDELCLNYQKIIQRIISGWSVARAFETK